jgi:hypothetical protein
VKIEGVGLAVLLATIRPLLSVAIQEYARLLDFAQLESVPTPLRVTTSWAFIVVGFEPRMVVAGRLGLPVRECEWVLVRCTC